MFSMANWGPLQCTDCDRTIRVDFRPNEGEPVFYCKCTKFIGDLNLDLIDGPEEVFDQWQATP